MLSKGLPQVMIPPAMQVLISLSSEDPLKEENGNYSSVF